MIYLKIDAFLGFKGLGFVGLINMSFFSTPFSFCFNLTLNEAALRAYVTFPGENWSVHAKQIWVTFFAKVARERIMLPKVEKTVF